MKTRILVSMLAALLAACGPDTMSAAATGAAIKKQELEQGQKNLQNAREKIDQATQQLHQPRAEQ